MKLKNGARRGKNSDQEKTCICVGISKSLDDGWLCGWEEAVVREGCRLPPGRRGNGGRCDDKPSALR